MTCRGIQVGTGGQGANWCREYLPPHVAEDRIEVVAAVDIDDAHHENAIEHLDVPPERCFTDVKTAFSEVDADFCTIVVPPWVHEEVVDAAVEHDLDILSEKPIADTLNGWESDYIRAECCDETLVLDDRELTRYPYDADREGVVGGLNEDLGESISLDQRDRWANAWLVEEFVAWMDGGEPMETNVHDNLQSVALIEAAIESSHTGEPVSVQSLLEETRGSVSID